MTLEGRGRVLAVVPFRRGLGSVDQTVIKDQLVADDQNVLVSPHTAGITRQSRHNIARIAAEQMLDILDGKKPPRLLNPEVWPVYSERFARILGFRPEGAPDDAVTMAGSDRTRDRSKP